MTFVGVYVQKVSRGENQLKKNFISILHMRTFHCNNSTSEVHLPKNSKKRIFEIDSKWTALQKAHFHMHEKEACETQATWRGALTQNFPPKLQQKVFQLCPESGIFMSVTNF